MLVAPAFALAESGDVQAKIAALLEQIKQLQVLIAQLQGASTVQCIDISTDLSSDDDDANTNGEVTKIQKFLSSLGQDIYPEGRVTGYFGPATMRAVQRWQAAHNIVSSGDPDSTGFGFVGRRTRLALACKHVDASDVAIEHSAVPATSTQPFLPPPPPFSSLPTPSTSSSSQSTLPPPPPVSPTIVAASQMTGPTCSLWTAPSTVTEGTSFSVA